MELSAILPHVEALIFASEKPLTSLELTELINNALGFLDDKITLDQIESAVAGVIEKYDADFYPFEIRESGGGWQFLTKKDYHKTVAQLNGDKFLKRLSAASLETLAIIAYKQPITKGEIESIRGVNSDYSIQKLLEKELIIITGRNEELPGKPLVYATSKTFMDYFGINSPDELPSIKDVLSSQVLEPTQVPQPVTDGLFADAEGEDERPSQRDAETISDDETAEESQELTSMDADAAEDTKESDERQSSAEGETASDNDDSGEEDAPARGQDSTEENADSDEEDAAQENISEEEINSDDQNAAEDEGDADDPDETEDEDDADDQDASDEETDSEDISDDDVSDDLLEDDLIVRANGELTSEPEPVVDDMAEVIEPEQVIGEDEPDDVVAERLDDESEETDEEEDSADYADEVADSVDDDIEDEQDSDDEEVPGEDLPSDNDEPVSDNEDAPADSDSIDDNFTDEDTDPNRNPSPEKE